MKFNGWQRLWTVFSILCLVISAFYIKIEYQDLTETKHLDSFYNDMSCSSKDFLVVTDTYYILDKNNHETDKSILMVRDADKNKCPKLKHHLKNAGRLEEARKRGLITELKMPNGHTIILRKNKLISPDNKDSNNINIEIERLERLVAIDAEIRKRILEANEVLGDRAELEELRAIKKLKELREKKAQGTDKSKFDLSTARPVKSEIFQISISLLNSPEILSANHPRLDKKEFDIALEYWRLIKSKNTIKNSSLMKEVFLINLSFIFSVYILGWLVAWVINGFKAQE